jgi:hypothetical protein
MLKKVFMILNIVVFSGLLCLLGWILVFTPKVDGPDFFADMSVVNPYMVNSIDDIIVKRVDSYSFKNCILVNPGKYECKGDIVLNFESLLEKCDYMDDISDDVSKVEYIDRDITVDGGVLDPLSLDIYYYKDGGDCKFKFN